jgi:hypothetical protein
MDAVARSIDVCSASSCYSVRAAEGRLLGLSGRLLAEHTRLHELGRPPKALPAEGPYFDRSAISLSTTLARASPVNFALFGHAKSWFVQPIHGCHSPTIPTGLSRKGRPLFTALPYDHTSEPHGCCKRWLDHVVCEA